MVQTSELISSLAANAAPVRRLRPPLVRAVGWMIFAVAVLGLSAAGFGLRADLLQRLHYPSFALGLAASLATGLLSALAAFIVSLPDRSRLWLLLPVPTAAVWLSTIGYECLANWVAFSLDRMPPGESLRCLSTLILTSTPLSLSILIMLRYASRVRAWEAALAGSVAVAGLTASAMSLFHELDATLMILIWNTGTAALITALGLLLRRPLFALIDPA